MIKSTRRAWLATAGGGTLSALAGCLGPLRSRVRTGDGGGASAFGDADNGPGSGSSTDTPGATGSGPPTTDRGLPAAYDPAELADASRSGGPPPDGIPAIEEPRFTEASDPPSNLDDGDPVFGVTLNGDTRAYPQSILVWHEIVNDVIGGVPLSVTYCPLTGTAQAFHRGETTFGVSGRLVNTNLIMFDRATESWWPQVLAQRITGQDVGAYLEEEQVVWTTWERWRTVHPDSQVLTTDTGFARDYGRDPYGDYNPPSGYYITNRTLFPPLANDERLPPKTVVIGMRSRNGAVAVEKDALRDQQLIPMTVGDIDHVAIYDAALDTGYVYRLSVADAEAADDDVTPAETVDPAALEWTPGGIRFEGSRYAPDALPLARELVFDAMWLAWYGYYPMTELYR